MGSGTPTLIGSFPLAADTGPMAPKRKTIIRIPLNNIFIFPIIHFPLSIAWD
jgi:hypothetical protein